jgi:hypothetical protein
MIKYFININVVQMIEFVYGLPTPQFGDESSLSVRIRVGSKLKRFLCFVLIDVRSFRVPQVEGHCPS